MISVLLIWIYMIVTTGAAGLLLTCGAGRLLKYRPRDPGAILLSGLVAVTVYAQIWSLFGGVGIAANICMCLVLLVCVFVFRRQLSGILRDSVSCVTESRAILPAVILISLLMAFGASHGIMHYDTGLYHAQAIRWIEEYGAVYGLGNLHTRLGYNSSAFVLNALYSFFYTGQSYHVTGAFCALLLAFECILPPLYRKSPLWNTSSFVRLMGLYYLFTIFDEMVSPASDYYMVCLAFILIIRWVEAGEMPDGQVSVARFCMLSFLAAFIVTVKLSGALFVLLAIFPAAALIRSRRFRELISCIVTGVIIVCPYTVRNAVISGWLLYPSTTIDLFDVDWKVPAETASYDYREISVYGRGYTDVARYDEPVTAWLPDWFAARTLTDRVLICAAVVGIVYFVIKCICYVCLRIRRASLSADIYRISTEAVVSAGFLFWLMSSPLMRYGCLYVYLVDAVIWGGVVHDLIGRYPGLKKGLYVAMALLIIYKCCMLTVESVRVYRPDTWIVQQDYDVFDVHTYDMSDEARDVKVTFYAPDSGDCAGYYAFPSSPWEMNEQIRLRGTDINEGFRAVSQ